MATLKDLKEIVLSLPETSEGTHFHLISYKVSGKSVIGIEKDNKHITMGMDKPDIKRLAKENPDVFEEIWRSKKYLIGVRFNIERVSKEQLKNLVELTWQFKAPKKKVKEFKKGKA